MSYDWTAFDKYPGWRSLIDPLIEECKAKGIVITQIKEKFGGLRFYVGYIDAADDALRDNIAEAERKSFTMCESCGKPAKTKDYNGWLLTLCDKHKRG